MSSFEQNHETERLGSSNRPEEELMPGEWSVRLVSCKSLLTKSSTTDRNSLWFE